MSSQKKLNLGILSDYRSECYGFCAVWIVLFHARLAGCDFTFNTQSLSAVDSFISLGNFGVDVFIFLSGISCYFSWSKRPDAGVFLNKRIKRIVPAVLLLCGPFWLSWVVLGEVHWTRLLYNATIVLPLASDGSQSVWYAAAILLLYSAYPYIHAAIYGTGKTILGEKNIIFRTTALCVLILICFWMLHKYNPVLFRNMEIMAARIPTFCIGAYVGHIVKDGKSPNISWVLVSMASMLYVAYAVFAFDWVERSFWWWRITMIPGGIIGAYWICRIFAAVDGVRFARLFRVFFCLTGGFSLELYVAHVMYFWSRGLFPAIGGNVAIALALSCCSWITAYLANRFLYVWFHGGLVSGVGRLWRSKRWNGVK